MVHKRLSAAMVVLWLISPVASSQPPSSNDSDMPHYVFTDVTIDGADNDMVDFGFYIKGTIGGLVWNDAPMDDVCKKGNGILDKGEELLGLKEINISLYDDETDTPIGITSTNDTGHYTFEVPYGMYRVVVGAGQYFPGEPVINYKGSPWGINTDRDYFVIIDKNNLKNTTINFGLQIYEYP